MIRTNPTRFKEVLKNIDSWKIPEIEKKRLKAYIEEYMSGDVTGLCTEAPEKNLESVIYRIRPALVFINKDIKKLTEEDIKKFCTALLRDEIQNLKGDNYVTTSKKRIYTTLKKYLEHHDIQTKVIKPLKKRIKIVKNTKDIITEEDLERLCNIADENWKRYTHQVLFWGGLRASEFLGLMLKDISLPENNKSNFIKIQVRRENTKSDAGERVVTLYGKNCYKAVKDYIEQRIIEGMKKEDLIFNKRYDAIKSWLYRLSFKLNKPLNMHLYRHSSASLLCPSPKYFQGNMIRACDFFGWEYNSPVVKVYIRRKHLIEEDEIDKQVTETSLEDMEKQLSEIKLSKDMQIENMKQEINKLTASFVTLSSKKSMEVYGK